MTYLKNKANIDDVNKALVEIHTELDSKSSLEDFNHAMDNQNSINTKSNQILLIPEFKNIYIDYDFIKHKNTEN